MKKTSIILASLIAVLALGVGLTPLVHAKDGADDSTSQSDNSNSDNSSDDSDSNTEAENKSEAEHSSAETRHKDRLDRINEDIAKKRTEFEQKMEQRKERVKKKLEGKRLDLCQSRQDRINNFIQNSTERAKAKLAIFQKIEKGVIEFYTSNNLSASGYDAAVSTADEKQAAAIAAIDAMGGLTFSCDNADGSNPAGVIRQAKTTRHEVMKAYRESIHALIQVVKAAAEEAKVGV